MHFSTLAWLMVFTAVFYFVFAWFREQACTMVCPYGRLQGVLIDENTLNVQYDYKRGEAAAGRSSFKKGEDRKAAGKGDCIDCNQCVVVCPTGIDIRNGIQMECVNCTACIDACDEVMEKVGYPTGLIRYATINNIEQGEKWSFFRPRVLAYSLVLMILVGVGSSFLFLRSSVQANFSKVQGTDYVMENQNIVNNFRFTLLNKSHQVQKVQFKLLSHKGEIKVMQQGQSIKAMPGELTIGLVKISLNQSLVTRYRETIEVGIFDATGKQLETVKVSFTGPFKY
ncbi:MAG: hypothetical protein C4K58_04795 [Flavobacteriaceae bacterium]|nr:MAG: hypothetical protein C4K58_04795 [Flavobacteriaceae bacterium]